MATHDMLQLSLDIFDKTYLKTNFPDSENAVATFGVLRGNLSKMSNQEGPAAMWKKFCLLGMTVFSCSSLNDMVKIVWRMVKDKGGQTQDMFCLFIIGIAAILHTLREKKGGTQVDQWEGTCITWLGNQLTIGGKGVTGEGEGSALDRIQRFFTTPYLHDFD